MTLPTETDLLSAGLTEPGLVEPLSDASWDTTLDEFERDVTVRAELIVQLQATPDAGHIPSALLEPWQPPHALGAMTAAQRNRAETLLADLTTQELMFDITRAATMQALQRVAQQLGPNRSRSAAIDHSGSFEARA